MLWPDYHESLSSCRQNYSYFATSDFMSIGYHVTAIINTPLSVLAFYVISKKTPAGMKKMRSALLFAQFCCTNLDVCCNLVVCPYAFFPTASGLTLGILSRLGVPFKWQGYWGQVSIMLNGVAFVMLYENRQSQVTTIRMKIKNANTRRVYCLALIILAFLSILPFYLEETDQVELRKYVLARVPCPTIEFFDPGTYVLLKGGEAAPFLSLTLMSLYIILQSVFFAVHVIFHTVLIKNAKLSKETRALQRKFLRNITLQIAIPLLALVFPTAYSLYADKNNYYNQAYNNFALLAFANHGLLATGTTLIIYKPYRDFVFASFRKRRVEGITRSVDEERSRRISSVA